MSSYEHLRIEFLLTKALTQYQHENKESLSNDDDEKIQEKMDAMNKARKLVDEMLSRAKLKELAISKAEESASKRGSKAAAGPLKATTRRAASLANENEAEDDERQTDKLKKIKAQVEDIEEKYELSQEAIKKLLESGPGLSDIFAGTVFGTDFNEEAEGGEEETTDSTRRAHSMHRANVKKANLLIRCYAQVPYFVEPRLSSLEMKKIGAVIEAVLDGSYVVNHDY